MSWAEIKKAINSDLSLPLNELITQGVYGLQTSRGSGSISKSSNYKTVVNITGKGYLANALFNGVIGMAGNSRTLKFRIIIDNSDILHVEFTPTFTSTSGLIRTVNITVGIVNLKSGVFIETSFKPFADYNNINNDSYSNLNLNNIQLINLGEGTGRKFIKLSSELQIIPIGEISKLSTNYFTAVALTNNLIRFEKNIKIQVLGDGEGVIGNGEYLATYILDE